MEYNPTPTRPCRPVYNAVLKGALTDAQVRLIIAAVTNARAEGFQELRVYWHGETITTVAVRLEGRESG